MRRRWRYVAFRLRGGDWGEIQRTIDHLKGKIREPAVKLMEYSRETGCGLLRCEHLQLPRVKTEISEIGKKIDVMVLGVSGTLKAAKRKFLPHRPTS